MAAQLPAFPGALGFGANATGGRNGTVYRVTTLADSGAGSLRDAASKPNRIIVFDVGGYITISSELALNDNLTIAGQTAPGGGIGIIGNEVSCGASTNIIIRHVRFRPGTSAPQGSAHCLNMYASTNIIVDHVSFEFGPWNNIGGVNVDRVTIQNCLIADPINQQFGAHIEHLNSSCACIYNLWANGHNRQPLATINMVFVNNTVYNYQAAYTTSTSAPFKHDLVNNYFVTGPATTSAGNNFYQIESYQSFYTSGNLRDSNNDGLPNGSATVPSGVTNLAAPWSPVTATIPTFSAASALRYSLSTAGAWPRDQVDDLVVSQVKRLGNGPTGTGAGTAGPGGGLYTSQAQTGLPNGGFGTLNGGAQPVDTDQDGMPDYWEKAVGLNLNGNDAMTIVVDGYANIEHYLNWLAGPHVLAITNQAVELDLWLYTSGFTNASPAYYLDNATNGTLALTNGHVVRFAPATDFSGVGGFRFAVVGSDGTAFTGTVSVVVSPLAGPSDLVWRGDGIVNLWTVGGAANWSKSGSLVSFTSGDNVTFDDTGSNSPSITLTNAVTPGSISFVASQDYTIGGGGFLVGGGTLYKVGPGNLFINTLNTFSGGVIISEGTVQLGDGVSTSGSLAGNITNNDTLILANPTDVSANTAISGSGALIKTGAGKFALNGTQTYTNLTAINAGTLEFAGTPPAGDITNRAALTFKSGASITYARSIDGPGSLNINASGQTVTLSGASAYTGGTTNTAGTLQLGNNNAAGSGPVTYLAGAVKVGNGVVIANTFVLPSSTADLMLDSYGGGTATWAGDIVATGGGASFRPGGTDGKLVLTGTAALGGRNFIIPKGSVEIAGSADFSATGTATAFGRNTTANSAFVTIRNDATVALGRLSLGGGQDTGGRVTLTLQDNASLSTGTDNLDLHNSTRTATWTVVTLNGGVLTVGGFVKTMTGATQFSTNNFNGGTLRASKDNASFLPSLSGLTAIVQAGGAKVDDNGFAITIAQPLLHDPALGTAQDGGLTKLGSGTVTLMTPSTYNGPTVINAGTLKLSCSTACGTIANSTNIYVAASACFDTSAHTTFTLGAGRTLWGNGAVIGNFMFGAGASLEPGTNAPGAMSFAGNLTLSAGSTCRFDLNRGPRTNDTVTVAGTVKLGGTLVVTNAGGELQANDSFTLFRASVFSNTFSTVSLPPLKVGLVWNTNQLYANGIISVIGTAPPVFGSAALVGGDLVMSGSNGTPRTSYFVLTSTNLALPINNWTRAATNRFAADGTFVFTNPVPPDFPVLFHRLQLP